MHYLTHLAIAKCNQVTILITYKSNYEDYSQKSKDYKSLHYNTRYILLKL
jgi:hypothetical protein